MGGVPLVEAVVSGLGVAVPVGIGLPTLNTGKLAESPMKPLRGVGPGLSRLDMLFQFPFFVGVFESDGRDG
jgi:hypothetical protein